MKFHNFFHRMLLVWSTLVAAAESPEFVFQNSETGAYKAIKMNRFFEGEMGRFEDFLQQRDVQAPEASKIIHSQRRHSYMGNTVKHSEQGWSSSSLQHPELSYNRFKSVQPLGKNTLLALTEQGNLLLLSKSNQGPVTKILWNHELDPHRQLVDFAFPSEVSKSNDLWLLFHKTDAPAGESHFQLGHSNESSLLQSLKKPAESFVHIGSSKIQLPGIWTPHTDLPATTTSTLPASTPALESTPKETPIPKQDSPGIQRFFHAGAKGQSAEDWMVGSPRVRDYFQKLLEGRDTPNPALNHSPEALTRERAFLELIDHLSHAGVFVPVSLHDIVWDGKQWLLRQLPSSDGKIYQDPQRLKARYLEAFEIMISNSLCHRALGIFFGQG